MENGNYMDGICVSVSIYGMEEDVCVCVCLCVCMRFSIMAHKISFSHFPQPQLYLPV